MRTLFTNPSQKRVTEIPIKTIVFNAAFEDSPLVQMYKDFKMKDHIPLVENEAKFAELKNESLNKARKAGIRDEKMGMPMEEGCDAFCKKALAPLEAIKKQAEIAKVSALEMHNQILEKEQHIDQDTHIQKVKSENEALLSKVQAPIENDIRECEANIKEQERIIKDTNITLASDENEYPEERPYINRGFVKWLFMIFLMLPEFSITFLSLQGIVDEGSNFQLFATTLGLGISYAWLSDLLGKFLYKNNRKKIIVIGILSVLLLLFVSAVRIMTGANLLFTVFYIILFVLGSVFAYLREEKQHHYDTKDANKKAVNKRNKELGKKDILEGQLKTNEKTFEVACEQNKKSAEKYSELIEDNGKAIKNKFDKIISGYADNTSILKTDLEEEYKLGYKIAKQSNPSISNLNGAVKNGAKAMTVLLIVCLSLITSCTPPETVATGVVGDPTNDRPLENPEGEIMAIHKLNAHIGRSSGRHFYSTIISDRSFGQICSSVPLPKSKYWMRNEIKRTEEIKRYEHSCDSILQMTFESMDGSGRKASYILRNIQRISSRMNEAKADRNRLIIYSDMLSHNSVISFYDFRDRLDEIENNREEIADILNKDSSVDLKGYELIVVHQPSVQNDELIRRVWEFWEWYFIQHCNAKSIRFEQSLI
ncbi:MAG: hypothetical protein KDD03_11885 [Gelidibacter sp.]|nr:hypothetical protein [Gelidibacter sp.]